MVASEAVWVRRSAIRPIPRYSLVSARAVEQVLGRVARWESDEVDWATEQQGHLDALQPALAAFLVKQVAAGEPLVSLARELRVCLFLLFESEHVEALQQVTADQLGASEAGLRADEELRVSDPVDPLDSEDIVGIEQPDVMNWLNASISSALAEQAEVIDVDDLGRVFRSLLVAVLALSEAVRAPKGLAAPRGGEPVV